MRLGRNFTNLLYFEYLGEEDKRRLEAGELSVADMDATVQVTAKGDIARQVQVAKATGLDHVELDGAVPNPYLTLTGEAKQEVKSAAERAGISLSLHLPYSYVGANVCAPDEIDRQAAVKLHKRYLEFASSISCEYCVLHPGVVPFYHASGKYLGLIRANLVRSVLELGEFAAAREVVLHLENNTAFDNVFYELEEVSSVVEEVRRHGIDVYFNFDIGHWLTRADVGKPVPNPPEKIIEEIPDGMFKEVHLNDYVPGKRIFHPPLQEGLGLLKRENLVRYAQLVRDKGAELIVVETAIRTNEQVMRRNEIMQGENGFLRAIFG